MSDIIIKFVHIFKNLQGELYCANKPVASCDTQITLNCKVTYSSSTENKIHLFMAYINQKDNSFLLYQNELYELSKSNISKEIPDGFKQVFLKFRSSYNELLTSPLKLFKTDDCPVCMEMIKEDEHPIYTCGHYVHKECLSQCKKHQCPLCRIQVDAYAEQTLHPEIQSHASKLFSLIDNRSAFLISEKIKKLPLKSQETTINTLIEKIKHKICLRL
jgi:hypothetical protein